jgi:hypothetical protein
MWFPARLFHLNLTIRRVEGLAVAIDLSVAEDAGRSNPSAVRSSSPSTSFAPEKSFAGCADAIANAGAFYGGRIDAVRFHCIGASIGSALRVASLSGCAYAGYGCSIHKLLNEADLFGGGVRVVGKA